MTDLPEHDPHLLCNRRSASNFLELLKPSPDNPQLPQAPELADDRPLVRAEHVFIIKDDVEGRDDPALHKTLVGSLDQHWAELEQLNVTRRAGIFLELPEAEAIVGDLMHGILDIAMPVPPSLIISIGRSPPSDCYPRQQRIWLLADTLAKSDRLAVAERLAFYGCVVRQGPALVRLPGFYVRDSAPLLVSARGSDDSQGEEAVRHTGQALMPSFIGKKPVAAAA